MSTPIDINSIYDEMQKEEVLISYKGEITQELLSDIYPMVEARLEKEVEDANRRKKIFHVLVECLQNVFHHMESFKNNLSADENERFHNAMFVIARGEENSWRVYTGNYILNEKLEILKQRIDKVNGMNGQELKNYYLGSLSTSELSDKGGAGLGIIDIARKSANKIEYGFHPISDLYSFFTLAVKIN